MKWKEAAIFVLEENGKVMYPEDILDEILSRGLKETKGKTPILTLRSEIYRSCIGHENITKYSQNSIFFENLGRYGLVSWLTNTPQDNSIKVIEPETSNSPNKVGETSIDIIFQDDEDENVFYEGKDIYALHKRKERNKNLVDFVKKKKYSINPNLPCEICGFSFIQQYGVLGEKFIEAHHTKPLSELDEETITKPEDIVLVCSNCHKMLHRYRPWLLSIDSLIKILKDVE